MDFFNILILSFVQGFSEFLPISSSAHLIIIHTFLGVIEEGSIAFDVALHLGTILAIIVFFHQEFKILLLDAIKLSSGNFNQIKIIYQVIISTIPAVIFGGVLVIFNLTDSFRILPIIAFNLIFFGILLYLIDEKFPQKISFYNISMKQALIIGLAQALALIPGVSRSGICITSARALGIEKISAIKYGMIISIPAILGAAIITAIKEESGSFISQDFLVGIILSFLFGLVFIKFVLEFVKKFSFKIFMIYRIVLGFIILGFYFTT